MASCVKASSLLLSYDGCWHALDCTVGACVSDASPRAVEGYYRRAVRAVTAQCRMTLNQARCGLRRDLATREVPVECGVEAGARS